MDVYVQLRKFSYIFMYKNSFTFENRKENAVLATVHFIRFENAIKIFIPIFDNQLWTVALKKNMRIYDPAHSSPTTHENKKKEKLP